MKKLFNIIVLGTLILTWHAYADNAAGVAAINASNYKLAFQEFQEAANQGDSKALYNLGLMYEKGLGIPQSYPQAIQYYQQAVSKGNILAMGNLANLYTDGLGVQKNIPYAITLYKKAIQEKEIKNAPFNLALIYLYNAKYKNYKDAQHYLTISSNAGNLQATYFLGKIYLQGLGTQPDYQKAYNYLYKAKLLGDKDAGQGLAKLYAKLTPQQIQQLQEGTFKMREINASS